MIAAEVRAKLRLYYALVVCSTYSNAITWYNGKEYVKRIYYVGSYIPAMLSSCRRGCTYNYLYRISAVHARWSLQLLYLR
jgi:hypothetical protein